VALGDLDGPFAGCGHELDNPVGGVFDFVQQAGHRRTRIFEAHLVGRHPTEERGGDLYDANAAQVQLVPLLGTQEVQDLLRPALRDVALDGGARVQVVDGHPGRRSATLAYYLLGDRLALDQTPLISGYLPARLRPRDHQPCLRQCLPI